MAGSSYSARNSLSSSIIEYEYMWKLRRTPLSFGGATRRARASALGGSTGFAVSPEVTRAFPIVCCLWQWPVCDDSEENDLYPRAIFH